MSDLTERGKQPATRNLFDPGDEFARVIDQARVDRVLQQGQQRADELRAGGCPDCPALEFDSPRHFAEHLSFEHGEHYLMEQMTDRDREDNQQ